MTAIAIILGIFAVLAVVWAVIPNNRTKQSRDDKSSGGGSTTSRDKRERNKRH